MNKIINSKKILSILYFTYFFELFYYFKIFLKVFLLLKWDKNRDMKIQILITSYINLLLLYY